MVAPPSPFRTLCLGHSCSLRRWVPHRDGTSAGEMVPSHLSPCSQKALSACWGLTLGTAGTGPVKLQGQPWHKQMFQSGNLIYIKKIWICWVTEYSQLWGAVPYKKRVLTRHKLLLWSKIFATGLWKKRARKFRVIKVLGFSLLKKNWKNYWLHWWTIPDKPKRF